MSDTPKRTPFDPAALAASLQALTGVTVSPVVRPILRLDALAVVDRALDALSQDPAPWRPDGPYLLKDMAFENGWIIYQQPGSGGTFGPDFQITIDVGGENVLSVKWYEESGDEKKVFNFRPGAWISDI